MSVAEPAASSAGEVRAVRRRLEVLAAGILWSLGGVFIKSIAAPAPVIAATRSFFAALVFAPFVRRLPSPSLAAVAGSVVTYTGVVGLLVWSTKVTTAANAIILQYTAPAFVFLIEALRGARPSRRDLMTLAGGMAGVAVIYLGSEPGDLLGISTAIASGVFFAAWMVIAGAARGVDPLSLTVANNLGAAAILTPFALASHVGTPRPGPLLALALMGLLQLGLPYVLFTRSLGRISSSEASLLALAEPVANPVWVALFVGEVPSRATIAGGAVILATLALRYLWPMAPARAGA